MSGDISNSCLCGDAFIFYHSTAPPEKCQVPSSPAASFRPSRHTLRFGLGVWESPPEPGAAERPRKAALSLLAPPTPRCPQRAEPGPAPPPARGQASAGRHRLHGGCLRAAHAHWGPAGSFWRLLRVAGSALR